MTRVYGSDTADLETDADERYLLGVVDVLEQKGYRASSVLLYGPDRASKLINQLGPSQWTFSWSGRHGHGLIRDLLFGQTVDKVRHGLDIPMLIARPMDVTAHYL